MPDTVFVSIMTSLRKAKIKFESDFVPFVICGGGELIVGTQSGAIESAISSSFNKKIIKI